MRENEFDIIIIGAGLLGCFAARALSSFKLKVLVLEKREDVCCEISKANSGIIYDAYNTKPDSLKTKLTIKANASFEKLCSELDVPYLKCGSIMVATGPRADKIIQSKYENGILNDVKDLKILSKDEILALEPNLSDNVTSGLYSKNTFSVNPWDLAVAAYENASANGVKFYFNEEVSQITRNNGFVCKTGNNTYKSRVILNCAGLFADKVHNLCNPEEIELKFDAADYFVFDTTAKGLINHVIFHEPDKKGKGINLIPTVDGNILAGPSKRDVVSDFYNTEQTGFDFLENELSYLTRQFDNDKIIRSFGSVRPNPYYIDSDDKINDFMILENDGFFSLIGVKTPGLTCADELGKYMAERITDFLGIHEINENYNPNRKAIPKPSEMDFEKRNNLINKNPSFGKIVCRCRQVSEGEIIEAIKRGADTLDGVKKRTGAGMGRCQGAYCSERIMELIAEINECDIAEVKKNSKGSYICK